MSALRSSVLLVALVVVVLLASAAPAQARRTHRHVAGLAQPPVRSHFVAGVPQLEGVSAECLSECVQVSRACVSPCNGSLECVAACEVSAVSCAIGCALNRTEPATAIVAKPTPVKDLTPKEKCLAQCSGNGLQCAVECPAAKAGMLSAADLTCREECAIKAAACAAMCVLAVEEPAVQVAAVPVKDLTPKEKCLATCAGNGLQCAAECPASAKAGMLTAANDISCREECGIKAAACSALCVLAAEESVQVAAAPVKDLTPKEKCLATCAGNGLQCAAECPATAKAGMLTAADFTCREECGIKAAACSTLCVLAVEEAAPVQAVPVKDLTPKEKCLATCAGNGLQCAAECPASAKAGMLTAANDFTCRQECGIKATACATLCVLAVEEPAQVAAVPVKDLTPKEKCLATCAGNGLQCAAECPAALQKAGMLTASNDFTCREECGIKAAACSTLCVLAVEVAAPAVVQVAAAPVKDLTPKEKCLATCAGNGLQCAAECPASAKAGMLTAADFTCREECGIKAAACSTLCVL